MTDRVFQLAPGTDCKVCAEQDRSRDEHLAEHRHDVWHEMDGSECKGEKECPYLHVRRLVT